MVCNDSTARGLPILKVTFFGPATAGGNFVALLESVLHPNERESVTIFDKIQIKPLQLSLPLCHHDLMRSRCLSDCLLLGVSECVAALQPECGLSEEV